MLFARTALTSLLGLFLIGTASGATFGVSPLRVELSPAQPTAVVTVTNEGDRPLTIQATGRIWTQSAGKDVYEDTRDLILNPAVFSIGPGKRQLLRVALRVPADPRVEKSYRLFVTEVPQADESAPTGVTMRIAIQMNLPLYVAPLSGKGEPAPSYSGRFDSSGAGSIVVRNNGNGHLRMTGIKAILGAATLLEVPVLVVLPGSIGTLELPKQRVVSGDTVTLKAEGNAGPVDVPVALNQP